MTDGKDRGEVVLRHGGAIVESDDRTLASYLVQVRRELEENLEAREMVAAADPPSEAREELLRILRAHRSGRDVPVQKPGSDGLLEAAVDQVLGELGRQRSLPPSLYLVNSETGGVVMPIPSGGVYHPPDYVGEDGETHRAKPIVHPGLTSSLAMAAAAEHRKESLLERHRGDPVAMKALEHLTEPQKMVQDAGERLRSQGVSVSGLEDGEDPEESVEFGREHVNGVLQSPNLSFHRSSMFAGILATRLLKMCGSGGEVRVGRLREKSNGKQRWYQLGVTVRRPEQLQ